MVAQSLWPLKVFLHFGACCLRSKHQFLFSVSVCLNSSGDQRSGSLRVCWPTRGLQPGSPSDSHRDGEGKRGWGNEAVTPKRHSIAQGLTKTKPLHNRRSKPLYNALYSYKRDGQHLTYHSTLPKAWVQIKSQLSRFTWIHFVNKGETQSVLCATVLLSNSCATLVFKGICCFFLSIGRVNRMFFCWPLTHFEIWGRSKQDKGPLW